MHPAGSIKTFVDLFMELHYFRLINLVWSEPWSQPRAMISGIVLAYAGRPTFSYGIRICDA